MMGRQENGQEQLFYSFRLEDQIPANHLVRRLDHFLDLTDLRTELADHYSHTGRPSVDPELMIRMLIVGYCYGIRSERQLSEELRFNLAYKWFCRLGLEDKVPDHSTFSKNRHGRFRDSNIFRHVFEQTVRRCMSEGLVGGDGFAVDASLIAADANKQRSLPGPEWNEIDHSGNASRAVKDYLYTLDDEAFGAASPVVPKFISPADPAAQWTGALRGPAFFAYATNYMIDVKYSVILDVEASRAIRQAEVGAARTMIERSMDRFGLYPESLAADTAYGSADMLGWLVYEYGIEPHIPVIDKSKRDDGTFSREDFHYDLEEDRYICPGGKNLRQYRLAKRMANAKPPKDGLLRYRASKTDCDQCHLKQRCCPKDPARKILRHIFEGARDMARDIVESEAYETSRKNRKKVEMAFAHLKRILKLGRLRLRGPSGAKDEFVLAATAQNLRKLAKLVPSTACSPA
jgi:transposase